MFGLRGTFDMYYILYYLLQLNIEALVLVLRREISLDFTHQ
jgi:hypothetical protein